MSSLRRWTSTSVPLLVLMFGGILMVPRGSAGQQEAGDSGYRTSENAASPGQQDLGTGYSVTESAADKAADKGDLHAEGPVRMARFAYVAGNVTWRSGPSGDWSQAVINMPLRQDAEILVLKGGRADIQFDDGSALRLGNGALVTLKTLFSDDKGEFTEITIKDGLATLHSRHGESVFQVDTPVASVKTGGEAQIRFGVDGGAEIAVQKGSAAVESPVGKTTVEAGNYVYLETANTEFQPKPTPAADSWDSWNTERDRYVAGTSETYKHVPPNIGLVSEDMDGYGTWHKDVSQGWVWSPNNQPPDWRPYQVGHWVWVDPYGWTWVSDEPWGWAPYHYGTWCRLSWGWSWCPGPRFQYWSPGVVSFSTYGGGVCWAPLCPWEVVYPTYCGVGFWGPNWCLSFSIGWCGCYFPFRGGFCEGRRFDNHFVNGFRNGDRFRGEFAGFGPRGGGPLEAAGANHGFVPYNAKSVAGATSATKEAFGGRGAYTSLAKGTSAFGGGRTVTAPGRGTPLSGPSSVQPTAASRTATRTYGGNVPSQVAAARSTFQGSQASAAVQSSSSGSSSFTRSTGASSGSSAAEAARAARASLGYSSSGSSGYSRSGTGSGTGYSGRSTGGAGESTRSGGTGSYSGGSRSTPSYRVGPSYGGSGYSGGNHSSGGGASSGGHSNGGGGGSGGGHH